jgi:diacylglycerol kinase family enzyme
MKRRAVALAAILLFLAAVVLIVVTATNVFPRGLFAACLLVLALVAAWEAIQRRGAARTVVIVLAAILLVGFGATLIVGDVLGEAILAAALLGLAAFAAQATFRIHVPLPAVDPPKHPVMVWNPKSGGGKAVTFHIADEARARGIEPIELQRGDDLLQLVRDAVDNGADALAAAGGDGTQALVATIAAELDLPFACIPAGTRNHFALDLGVDRDDVVGALDAFVNGGEKRVDLAEVNGRVFVNNTSLGIYAEAVQSSGYRDAKLRTMLDTIPEFTGTEARAHDLKYVGPDGTTRSRAAVIMVSNNSYRLGHLTGSGTRPRLDDGELGIAVLGAPADGTRSRTRLVQWNVAQFDVSSDQPVPVGVDGEALVMDPPLRFKIRPGALRVRIAPQHPGASPSAAQPDNLIETIRRLIRTVVTGDPQRTP